MSKKLSLYYWKQTLESLKEQLRDTRRLIQAKKGAIRRLQKEIKAHKAIKSK